MEWKFSLNKEFSLNKVNFQSLIDDIHSLKNISESLQVIIKCNYL